MSASSSCVFDCQQGFFTLLPAPASSSSLQERSRGLMFDGNPWAPFSWELSGFPGIEMTLLVCFYFLYSKMTMRKKRWFFFSKILAWPGSQISSFKNGLDTEELVYSKGLQWILMQNHALKFPLSRLGYANSPAHSHMEVLAQFLRTKRRVAQKTKLVINRGCTRFT